MRNQIGGLLVVGLMCLSCSPESGVGPVGDAPSMPSAEFGRKADPTCRFPRQVKSITLVPATVTLTPGGTVSLSATSQEGRPIPACALDWTTGDPAVVAVNSQGLVTGVAPGGPVTIVASLRTDADDGDDDRGRKTKLVKGTAFVSVGYPDFTWTITPVVAAPEGIQGLSGTSANDVWAPCGYQCVFHFDGTTWQRESVGGVNWYRAFSRTPTDVFFAGQAGIMAYDGTGFSVVAGGQYFGVWSDGSGSGFACGEGTLVRFLSGQPPADLATGLVPIQQNRFEAGWGTSSANMYCAGAPGVFRYDGAAVTKDLDVPGLHAIHGSGPADVWVAGSVVGNALWHFDGASWSLIDAGQAGSRVNAVYAASAGTAFVAISDRLAVRDQAVWRAQPLPAGYRANDNAIYAPSARVVFLGATRLADNVSVVIVGVR